MRAIPVFGAAVTVISAAIMIRVCRTLEGAYQRRRRLLSEGRDALEPDSLGVGLCRLTLGSATARNDLPSVGNQGRSSELTRTLTATSQRNQAAAVRRGERQRPSGSRALVAV